MASTQKRQDGTGFTHFATNVAGAVGRPWAFFFALATVVAWLTLGPRFGYSDTWQLVMNSWSNVATLLMVFLIQNSQNRDSKAINLKLDEIIHSSQHARDDMIDIEKMSDEQLEQLARRYEQIRHEYEQRKQRAGEGEHAA